MTHPYFEYRTRTTTGERYTVLADSAPAWVAHLIQECHDGELPNDWRYDAVVATFEAIAGGEKYAENIADGLLDAYNGDLLKWLGDDLSRAKYIEEARENYDGFDSTLDVFRQIGAGQYFVLEQIAETVLEAVRYFEGEEES